MLWYTGPSNITRPTCIQMNVRHFVDKAYVHKYCKSFYVNCSLEKYYRKASKYCISNARYKLYRYKMD